ncbi:M48 family metallopeptidase [Pseudoalteromonas sp. JBTF-M23]|uniref:M48 family metallopeptidase n=1 Tax=Pseudoalteromonas caenipelagi TaxID=2726988 RepID=A0A849VC96_9GAMM|nr:SprT family zinc-dependent metalloprotease [Pseudoalteromonas caenipelagi]NOU50906.1 M48 family metallopeptidase [Pseudoalteromonas caenipelagi]
MFEYQLKLSKKRKTIALKVTDNGVLVYAPQGACIKGVERWLETKTLWVAKQQQRLAKSVQQQIPWNSGKLLVFGNEYAFTCDRVLPSHIDHLQQKVVVHITAKSSTKSIRLALVKLLAAELEQYIDSRLHTLSVQMNSPVESVKFREYKSRWGSCSSHYALTFNVLLAGAPKRMIDYVMVHELAHCHVMAHNRAFWSLVAMYDSNYKEAVSWFKTNGKQLFIAKD